MKRAIFFLAIIFSAAIGAKAQTSQSSDDVQFIAKAESSLGEMSDISLAYNETTFAGAGISFTSSPDYTIVDSIAGFDTVIVSQTSQAFLDSATAYLDSLYSVAINISDDPVTGYSRIAYHTKLTLDTKARIIYDEFRVNIYKGDSIVDGTNYHPFDHTFAVTSAQYVDSLGYDLPEATDSTAGAIPKYDFLVDQVKGTLFPLIKLMVERADELGKFDQ